MAKENLINWKKYIIKADGKILSRWRNNELSCKLNKNGYIDNAYSMIDGTFKHLYRSRVIWTYFNGEIPEGYEIDHIDTDRTNNSLDNLRCVSKKDNRNNPLTIKHYKESNKGKSEMASRATSKEVNQYTSDGLFVRAFKSVHEAERETGICCTSISRCCIGGRYHYGKWQKCKTAGGYIWKYAN